MEQENIKRPVFKKAGSFFFVGIVFCALLVFAAAGGALLAQDTAIEEASRVRQQRLDQEAQRSLELRHEMAQRLLWDWGAYERFNFLTYDDIDNRNISDKRRTMKTNNFYLWGNLNLDDIHSFYLRFHGEHIDWNQGDEYRSTENQFHFNIEEGFDAGTYAMNIDKALESYLDYTMPLQMKLTIGRFRSHIGNQMVYWKTGNGIQLDGKSKWLDFKLFGFKNLIDEENIDYSVPGFRSTRRYFYGAEIKYNGLKKHEPYLFALIQEDDNDESPEDFDQDYKFDSRYYGIGARGEIYKDLYYEVEGILEDGNRYPQADAAGNPPDDEDIDAWAFDASLRYKYDIITHPAFSAEYAFGSGDSDRTGNVTNTIGGNKEGTTDRGFLGFGYINTGVSMAPRLSNLHMYKCGLSFLPTEFINKNKMEKSIVKVGVDFFLFRKDKSDAAISDTRADRPQKNLGREFDVNITWKIFSDLEASIDYGRFYPGNAYSDTDARDFVMLTMMYQF